MVLEGGCVLRKHPPNLTWKVVNRLEPALKLQGASGVQVCSKVSKFSFSVFHIPFGQNLTFLFCKPVAQFLPNRKGTCKYLVDSPTLPFNNYSIHRTVHITGEKKKHRKAPNSFYMYSKINSKFRKEIILKWSYPPICLQHCYYYDIIILL